MLTPTHIATLATYIDRVASPCHSTHMAYIKAMPRSNVITTTPPDRHEWHVVLNPIAASAGWVCYACGDVRPLPL